MSTQRTLCYLGLALLGLALVSGAALSRAADRRQVEWEDAVGHWKDGEEALADSYCAWYAGTPGYDPTDTRDEIEIGLESGMAQAEAEDQARWWDVAGVRGLTVLMDHPGEIPVRPSSRMTRFGYVSLTQSWSLFASQVEVHIEGLPTHASEMMAEALRASLEGTGIEVVVGGRWD